MSYSYMPAITSEAGLSKYLQEIQKFPILTEQEEKNLFYRLISLQDFSAAQMLVTSHLRLVAKIAMKYRGYGLPMTDIIAEGNLGLMHAIRKFAPEMGHRISTYAMWWIKAYIQDYILKSWSLVKIGTSAGQKTLFFNLRKIKNKILTLHGKEDITENLTEIAKQLNVPIQDVIDMDARLIGDETILNNTNNDGVEMIESITDSSDSPEVLAIESNDYQYKKKKMNEALASLSEREREIIASRMLREPALTLDELSQTFGISRERVRQIESKAMEKLQRYCIA